MGRGRRFPTAVIAAVVAMAGCGDGGHEVTTGSSAVPAPADGADDDLGPFVDCETVPVLATDLAGSLGGMSNPDDEVMGVLVTYGAEHPDTFAGLWIDRDSGGVLVMAFTDQPGPHREALLARGPSEDDVEMVTPRPPIADPRPLGERDDVVIDVVMAGFTEAELQAAQAAAFSGDQIPGLVGGGIGVQQNRLSFDFLDPPDGAIDQLAERVDPAMACVTVTRTTPPPTGPLQILSEDPADQLLSCGGRSAFPRSALDEPLPLDQSDHPAAVALAEELAATDGDAAMELSAMLGDDPEVVVLVVDDETALFGVLDSTGLVETNLSMSRAAQSWRLSGFGGCTLQVAYPAGLGRVEPALDPAIGLPGPEATTIALLVNERACASGQAMGDRLLEPQVIEDGDAVTMVFAAVPVAGGAECPSNPSTAVTIELSAPLGNRALLDGGVFPPAPLALGEPDS